MMAPFLDRIQMQNALNSRLSALEHLTADPHHPDRSLDRFRHDDPPPYVSSESEDGEVMYHPVLARSHESVLSENKSLIEAPLSEAESRRVAQELKAMRLYDPGARFCKEARREEGLLSSFYMSPHSTPEANEYLSGSRGQQRRHVIVRHNIRKRWQRLGIWNPEWGIPGRVNKQANDNTDEWKWKWQRDSNVNRGSRASNSQHPISRAVQLRRGLRCGEHNPPPPHSHPREDSSAAQAESFIISRPWFLFSQERVEYIERTDRIPADQWGLPSEDDEDRVTQLWKQRGDWEEDWEVPGYRNHPVPGWKWRHESASPEPEDLSALNNRSMDFTPSEVDALEAIPPSTPPLAPSDLVPPSNSGATDGPQTIWRQLFPGPLFNMPPADRSEETHRSEQADGSGNNNMDSRKDTSSPVPRRRSRSARQQTANTIPRRSARIAERYAASRAVIAAAPLQMEVAPTKRGRPRNGSSVLKAPAPGKRNKAAQSEVAAKAAQVLSPPQKETPVTARATRRSKASSSRVPAGDSAVPSSRTPGETPRKRGRPREGETKKSAGVVKRAGRGRSRKGAGK